MKMKKVLALLFALVFMLITAVPAFAAEGEESPILEPMEQDADEVPGLEEMDEPEEPEDPEDPEDLEDLEDLEKTEDSEEPEDSGEQEEPEYPEDSDSPEDSEIPEDLEQPEDSEEPEGTEEPEDSEEAEDPESLDEADPLGILENDGDIIDVLVPSYGQIIINPYRLEVGEAASTAQIVHQPQALINYSAFPVAVDVSIVGTVPEGSGAVLVSGPPTAGEKEVFLYAEFQNSPDWWMEAYTGASNQLIATEYGSYGEGILTLGAWGEGYFRLSGAMSAQSIWANTDTFGAVLVFTFSAAPVEAEDEADWPEGPDGDIAPVWEESWWEEPWLEPEDSAETESPAAAESLPVSGELPDMDFNDAPGQSFDTVSGEDAPFADEPLPNEPSSDELLPDEMLPDGTIGPDADLAEWT